MPSQKDDILKAFSEMNVNTISIIKEEELKVKINKQHTMNLFQTLKKWFKRTPENKKEETYDEDQRFTCGFRSDGEEAEHRAWLARVQERLRVINEREREKESKT